MKKKISCFEIDEYTLLPPSFYGKWMESDSIHEAEDFLKVDCHPHERGARWMTREEVIKEAQKRAENCLSLQQLAAEDWSIRFKKGGF